MSKPMMWIACDYLIHDNLKNREQFNGDVPAWGESEEDFRAKQKIEVPQVGDQLNLRMGLRVVNFRRLNPPETDDDGNPAGSWYWEIHVKDPYR